MSSVSLGDLTDFIDSLLHLPSAAGIDEYLNNFLNSFTNDTIFVIKYTTEYGVTNDLNTIISLDEVNSIIIIVKLAGKLTSTSNLNVINIPTIHVGDSSSNELLENIRSIINFGISPYFNLVSSKDNTNLINNAKNKFSELSLSLQHLQQKIQIPDLLISCHPKISQLLSGEGSEDDLINDTAFLNELTNIVNSWIKQIQSITSLNHTPIDGDSILDEIQFWKSMELALLSLDRQISSPEIKASIELLNKSKRYHITLTFQNNIGLNDKLLQTKLYNSLLKDLPIDDLLLSTNEKFNLQYFEEIINNIFNHFKRLKNLSSFPLTRAIQLIEVILNDISNKLSLILIDYNLMTIPLQDFLNIYNDLILRIFGIIDNSIKFIINLFRELLRKRQEKFFIIKINQHQFDNLKNRTKIWYDFRLKHNDLLIMLNTFLKDSTNLSHKLTNAYNNYIIPCNLLDLSLQSFKVWSNNENLYLSVYQGLESLIISQLNDYFSKCGNFNDFISVFSKFKISTAISNHLLHLINDEFKLKILSTANLEIESLINLNLNQNSRLIDTINAVIINGTHNHDTSIVAQITWNISLSNKLNSYLFILHSLLGSNWNKYSIGSEIYSKINKLIEHLDTNDLFQNWLDEVTKTEINYLPGSILKMTSPKLDIIVNFDFKLIELSEQLKQLTNLGFKVPINLLIQFQKIDKVYSFLRGLIEHINILKRILKFDLVETDFGMKFGFLIENQKSKILNMLPQIIEISWIHLSQAFDLQNISNDNTLNGSENLIEIVSLNNLTAFQNDIYIFYNQVNTLERLYDFIYHDIYSELEQCEFNFKAIHNFIKSIQSEVVKLSFDNFTEIDQLCNLINDDLSNILVKKCQRQLMLLSTEIDGTEKREKTLLFEKFDHSILLEDQSFLVSPPLEQTKQLLYVKVNQTLSVIETQPIVQLQNNGNNKFASLSSSNETLKIAVSDFIVVIDNLYKDSEKYFQKWISLQNIWELNLNSKDDLAKLLPNTKDLNCWLAATDKVIGLRLIFDNSDKYEKVGNSIYIDFTKVQSRVNLKFDIFQNDLMKKFSDFYQDRLIEQNAEFINAKIVLEGRLNFQDNFEKTINHIDQFLKFKNNLTSWQDHLSILHKGQKLLVKQRFKFPKTWTYVEQLENNFSIVSNLIDKKQRKITDNFEIIESKLISESIRLNDQINIIFKDWSKKKPIGGNLNPSLAINTLNGFEESCILLTSKSNSIRTVAVVLNISLKRIEELTGILGEAKDLKLVWSAINTLWENLNRINSTKWTDIQPRNLHLQLDELLSNSRILPSKIRQYSAFDEIQNKIKAYLRSFSFINNLKADSMKPRHWGTILNKLGFSDLSFDTLTVGDIWNLNFAVNEQIIKSVLNQANNEQIIEENLKQIRSDWSILSFEMFNYNNKSRLVRNWDALFDQCNSDINSLASMRNSPYYNNFEQEIIELEDNLNKLSVLLDTWIDVQRQWVYLDGVFSNENNDIRNILPVEFTRFANITFQFLNLLKRIYKYSLVIEVLSIPDIQSIMEKALEGLNKNRKSLTEYLEKQRELFPRFYFIGNEDLLEIIGCSTDMVRINKHLQKMFVGISYVDYDKESCLITAINSEQNEKVKLSNPVSLIKFPRINEWLKELELEVRLTLSKLTKDCITEFKISYEGFNVLDKEKLFDLIESKPAQVCLIVCQILFAENVESAIAAKTLLKCYDNCCRIIQTLTPYISSNLAVVQRLKVEHLIVEFIHQRDIITSLMNSKSHSKSLFIWNTQQLFYYDLTSDDLLTNLKVKQSNTEFTYGFEYLGIPEKLAYTPLVDKCFLSMTQALDQKLGGSPFGPAGTGKTETVKALGNNLGKMVLVFCCDESFDFQSMGRIFLGLCKVGCWGCFDEFNRLDEHNLSAVSSQIENIELGLSNSNDLIEISGKKININPETGIFVTMNPGYVGRSELPENLKKLFRSFSMEKPDLEIIVEVLLTSQSFIHSKKLASIIVPFFLEISQLSSNQSHYDFGLRALKNTLVKCGLIKRSLDDNLNNNGESFERKLIIRSIKETITPKLLKQDELILNKLQEKYFPNITYDTYDNSKFITQLQKYGSENGLVVSENFITKALQLYQIQNSHHGIMLVGDSGSGKTTIWKLVLKSMSEVESFDSLSFIIDCKVMSKDSIYGSLDLVTRDWTDGLFTSILRKIKNNLRGELSKNIWIIFDGDIDPEWVENLNSVLDDNKILTLPNGERLSLPQNLRLVFEVDNLKYTTPATISRCGMVWFDSSLVSTEMLFKKLLFELSSTPIQIMDDLIGDNEDINPMYTQLVNQIVHVIDYKDLQAVIDESEKLSHIMSFTIYRALETFFTILKSFCRRFIIYSLKNKDVPIDNLNKYIMKAVALSFIWAFAGDSPLLEREEFGKIIVHLSSFAELHGIEEKQTIDNYLDYDINLPECEWQNWNAKVQNIDLEPQHVTNPSTVIPTLDTVRHESLIYSILNEHKSLLLCGPPGSGKTMTLLEALRKSPNLDVLSLNFSKDLTPQSLMKSLEHYCYYKKTSTGAILTPKISGKWVVVFCDEINLPGFDKYGTQRVISLIRQMVEHKGFWNTKENQWVRMSNIQFVGACNSPNDPGRNKLSNRFLRHVSLIMVDYPGKSSLYQIYQMFNLAVMKCAPSLRGYTKTLTDSMIDIYLQTKQKLTSALQDHYIYSPRELTRWCKGILEALKVSEYSNLQDLVRLWYHEGLRLFYDRLVCDSDRDWTKELFRSVVSKQFPNVDIQTTLKEPVLYSSWLTGVYESNNENELRSFLTERLRVFSEEEIEVDLVLYEDLLDHSLRIDRVLRQPQGHMILVGPCTSGKTTLTKFVAWINGLKVIQLNVSKEYSLLDFEATLRQILIRCAAGERICFIIDESSILETSFVERMNTLLANAEIPGLFEGDDFNNLMNLCSDQVHTQNLLLDSNEELYDWFRRQISENLHVIFTLSEMKNANRPQVVSSPALFNRCVLSWMGDWSNISLYDIVSTLIGPVPLDMSTYVVPDLFKQSGSSKIMGFRDMIIDTLIYFHRLEVDCEATLSLTKPPGKIMSFVKEFIRIFNDKQFSLEETQRHITNGLDKLRETVLQVNDLKRKLSEKRNYLMIKDKEAKAMLSKMLTEQNEAERKQEFSVATQEELAKQEIEIERRKVNVTKDLELAEPAVLEAQRGVQNIKKQHLTEIRSMSNPPAAVKMTMESVCILIGYEVSSWRDVQLIVRRDDFISNIVAYDNELQLTSNIRKYMEKTYLSRSDYNFDAVNRASKACGPLLQWIQAQLTYSTILEKIGPLREEVHHLEHQKKKTKAQLIAIDEMIRELEESIDQYKENYSSLIREAENIKSEMKVVELRVNRSLKLIDDLTAERERWKSSINKFGYQRDRLVGNGILTAAFIVYAGAYDQKDRSTLMKEWRDRLRLSGINFDEGISVTGYLTGGDEMLRWKQCGLPNDDLNTENFTIMKRSKTPIIIDPPSKIPAILSKSYMPKKLSVTSFLNDGFVKQVENELRFGGTLLIQDAEYYDPILDSVLRHEIYRNGGRMMIKLGNQEIDFSPEFKLILHTRDSLIMLPPFVAARTSIVNFTVTTGSLENLILNTTLQDKRPDIEAKRLELVFLQSRYLVRLHELEEQLLNSLNDSTGNILDNDKVIETLEVLKAEAIDIDVKIGESNSVMKSVENERNKYYDIAKHSSAIFRIFKQMNRLNKLYHFSLEAYVSTFSFVLKGNPHEIDISSFIKELYRECYARISPSLKHLDKLVFAVAMSASYYALEIGHEFKNTFIEILKSVGVGEYIESLSIIFDSLLVSHEKNDCFTETTIDKIVSINGENESLMILSDIIKSLIMSNGDKKDSFLDALNNLASFLFTGIGPISSKYDLKDWISPIRHDGPIILASPENYDATYKVEQLAHRMNKKLLIVSMGSKEGIEIANKEIDIAAKNGFWIMIQNVQMSPNWLSYLDKRLESLSTHENFKIFMSCNLSSDIPAAMINKSKILLLENEPGLKSIVNETYNSIPSEILTENTNEYKHICFLLSWFHSIIQERSRYAPMSFTKKYDINDSDFTSGLYVIKKLLTPFKDGRSNISPELVPWEELGYLVGEITYGGQVDNKSDLAYITNLANHIFSIQAFETNFNLVENSLTIKSGTQLHIPEGISTEAYKSWIKSLPDQAPLKWVGLEERVSILYREREGQQVAQYAQLIIAQI